LARAIGIAFTLCGAGCGHDEGIRVCIDAVEPCREGACGDTLAVAVSLWREGETAFCEPATITTTTVLPYCVAIVPGDRYAEGVAVRADLVGDGALRARREVGFTFVPGRIAHHVIRLDLSCFAADPCADDAQCLDGACEPVPYGGRVFDGDPPTDVVAGDVCEAI
jgi:hypothetical protein